MDGINGCNNKLEFMNWMIGQRNAQRMKHRISDGK